MKYENSLRLKDRIVQSNGNIVSDMNGEKVMLSIKNSKYYHLGEVGGYIWTMIAQPKSISKLIEELKDTYLVTEVQCITDLLPFLEMLKNENLIEVL